jgi:hypothetical protein
MSEPAWESSKAWRELLDGLRDLDQQFLTGPKAVDGEQSVAEGYRFLAAILGVASDIYLFSDSTRPRFADINTPFRMDRRWGGDNTDAYYAFVPIDPSRTYRVWGNRADSAYFSLTVYNEPTPGQWSDQIIGIVNDSDLNCEPDHDFEFMMGPSRPEDYNGTFIELTPDSAAALTRDYQRDPKSGRRIEWRIEPVGDVDPQPLTDAAMAGSLRAALRWAQEMFGIVPLTIAPREDRTTVGHNAPIGANVMAPPYQVGAISYGWSAKDACYSFGSFVLDPGEALVITHRPPTVRFWNVTIWNEYMACHDLEYGRVSLNGATATPNSDGTVTIVVSRTQLEHPNSITTVDHAQGVIAFRWFHPDQVPEQPDAVLMSATEAPTSVS